LEAQGRIDDRRQRCASYFTREGLPAAIDADANADRHAIGDSDDVMYANYYADAWNDQP